MLAERSETRSTCTARGIEASSCGSIALIWSTTWIVFAPGCELDQQQLAGCGAEPAAGPRADRGIDHPADVLQLDRRAVAVGHDHIAELRRVEQLVVGVERVFGARAFEIALGRVDGRVRQRRRHLAEADAALGQRLRVHLDMHRRLLLAGDDDLPDPADRRELLGQHHVGVLVDLIERHRPRMDRVDQHRRLRRDWSRDRSAGSAGSSAGPRPPR